MQTGSTKSTTGSNSSPSAVAMANMILENGKTQNSTKYFNPFEATSYRTSVDKSGYYSYYTRGQYTSYSSYEYTGKSIIVSFEAESGQKCTYENSYQGWSQYGLDNYECTRETNFFVMQQETFKTIGLVMGFLFSFFMMFVAFGAHCIKVQYTHKVSRTVRPRPVRIHSARGVH